MVPHDECNAPNFDLECIKSNHVNDINSLVWIPSAVLKAKAQLANGYACMISKLHKPNQWTYRLTLKTGTGLEPYKSREKN